MTLQTPQILTTNLRIAELELGTFSPRKQFSPAYITELAESIKREGQLKPIIVRLHPTKPNLYQVIDGEHRVRAIKKLGRTIVRAEVRKLSDEEADLLAIRINQMHGKRLIALEEAFHIVKLHETHGFTLDEIAQKLNKSKGWVVGRWTLATKLSPKTKEAVTRVTLKPKQAIELAELPPEDQDRVIEKVSKLSLRQTEALVHALKDAETPEQKLQILEKPLGDLGQVVKKPEAFKRLVEMAPEQPVFQVITCPNCGKRAAVDWLEQTIEWQ